MKTDQRAGEKPEARQLFRVAVAYVFGQAGKALADIIRGKYGGAGKTVSLCEGEPLNRRREKHRVQRQHGIRVGRNPRQHKTGSDINDDGHITEIPVPEAAGDQGGEHNTADIDQHGAESDGEFRYRTAQTRCDHKDQVRRLGRSEGFASV